MPAPLLAAPPLILLKPGTTGTLRLLRTESDILPVDRETLFELSIASVPSGKVENQSVKVAMRSVFKLFWRPEGLRATRWKLINNYAGHGIRRVYNSLTQRLITLT